MLSKVSAIWWSWIWITISWAWFPVWPFTTLLSWENCRSASILLRRSVSVWSGATILVSQQYSWIHVCIHGFRRNVLLYCCTMLQKLSECEVKAWLCWNLIILLALRFYIKSNFGEIKWSKNVIFGNFRDSELWILVNLALEKCSNLLKIKIQNP